MREIKFRVWDKDVGRMFYNIDFISIINQTKEFGEHWFEFTEYRTMQYIGLKDKNGKEIYEGDILFYSEHYIGDFEYSAGEGVVEFDNGGFYIDENRFAPELCSEEIDNYLIEVVGNIYETPTGVCLFCGKGLTPKIDHSNCYN